MAGCNQQLKSLLHTSREKVTCEKCVEPSKAEWACLQCSLLVCTSCIQSGNGCTHLRLMAHVGSEVGDCVSSIDHQKSVSLSAHSVNSLSSAILNETVSPQPRQQGSPAATEALRQQLREQLGEELGKLRAAEKHIRKIRSLIQEHQCSLEQTTEQAFEQLHGILQQRKTTVLEEVAAVHTKKLKKLSSQEAHLTGAAVSFEHLLSLVARCGGADLAVCAEMTGLMNREMQDQDRSRWSLLPVEEVDVGVEVGCAEALQQLCQDSIKMTCASVDLDRCAVEFDEPADLVVGQVCSIWCTVTCTLTNGQMAWHKFEVQLISLQDIISVDNAQRCVNCDVRYHSNNRYKMIFEPVMRGRHKLKVLMNKQEVGQGLSLFVTLAPTQLRSPIAVWDHDHIGRNMRDPSGIAINSAGHVVVAEWKNGSLFILNKKGELIARVPVAKKIHHKIYGVAIDSEDSIYCTERYGNNDKILKCDKNGDNPTVETACPRKNQRGLTILGEELLVCDDEECGSVAVYDRDLKFKHRISVNLPGKEQTFHDLSCGPQGKIYATAMDKGAFDEEEKEREASNESRSSPCVCVFEQTGQLVHSFSCDAAGVPRLDLPRYICVAHGYVYVSDWQLHQIVVFTTAGEYVTSFGEEGTEKGQFKNPWGVCVDKDGFVYVCDSNNHRIQVF